MRASSAGSARLPRPTSERRAALRTDLDGSSRLAISRSIARSSRSFPSASTAAWRVPDPLLGSASASSSASTARRSPNSPSALANAGRRGPGSRTPSIRESTGRARANLHRPLVKISPAGRSLSRTVSARPSAESSGSTGRSRLRRARLARIACRTAQLRSPRASMRTESARASVASAKRIAAEMRRARRGCRISRASASIKSCFTVRSSMLCSKRETCSRSQTSSWFDALHKRTNDFDAALW